MTFARMYTRQLSFSQMNFIEYNEFSDKKNQQSRTISGDLSFNKRARHLSINKTKVTDRIYIPFIVADSLNSLNSPNFLYI